MHAEALSGGRFVRANAPGGGASDIGGTIDGGSGACGEVGSTQALELLCS